MLIKCKYCGQEITSTSDFCPFCGASVGANQSAQTQNNDQSAPQFQPTQQFQPAQPYNQQPNMIARREKSIKFVFVATLVFMIIYAIRSISGLSAIDTWKDEMDEAKLVALIEGLDDGITKTLMNNVYFSVVAAFITFVSIIGLFIVTTMARKADQPAKRRVSLAKVMVIMSIVTLVCSVVYLITEIMLLSSINKYIDQFGDYFQDKDAASSWRTSAGGSIGFVMLFAGLSVVSLIKALGFKADIQKKLKSQQNSADGGSVFGI